MPRGAVIAMLLAASVGCVFAEPPADSDSGPQSSDSHQLRITIRSIGGASGMVSVDGVPCPSGCTVSRAPTSSVKVTSADSTFQSFAVDCPRTTCTRTTSNSLLLSMSSDHDVEATFRPPVNYVFLSGLRVGAAMGGLAGADAICRARAEVGALGGTVWRAWLTTSTQSAVTRLTSRRGWMHTDGLPFAASAAAIARGETAGAPHLNELGVDLTLDYSTSFVPVWTGAYGSATLTCDDWTTDRESAIAYVGNAKSPSAWSSWGPRYGCSGWQLPLYCFQDDD